MVFVANKPVKSGKKKARDLPHLCKRLIELRERRGWSVSELSARTGIERWTIGLIEAGRTVDPRFLTLCKLADALGADLKEFRA